MYSVTAIVLYTILNLNSSPATSKHIIPDCVSIQNCIYGSSLTLIEWQPHILFLHVLCNDTDKIGRRSARFPLGAAYVLCQNISWEILLHVEILYVKYNKPKYTTNRLNTHDHTVHKNTAKGWHISTQCQQACFIPVRNHQDINCYCHMPCLFGLVLNGNSLNLLTSEQLPDPSPVVLVSKGVNKDVESRWCLSQNGCKL